ncbi:MBL fold metallo-hydrolase [Vagococcus sp.]|uniref:MBL fold metallo-hydrolase n=1 Tax=Vagococcus sp. TaxID=1933889 RepID=UPI000EC75236|nr:MBL fold metallo-hydrolase [Vagococcus sp.]HCT96293.1 MBL fold metallo-hydrolase [Vagococcus sp.]
MIEIKQLVTGPVEENCYFIYNDESMLIVDPGEDEVEIKRIVEELGRKPVAILLTHTHYDHIGAVETIRHTYDIPVYVHPIEQEWLGNPTLNLSGRHPGMKDIVVAPAEHEFELKDYTLGGMTFKVVHTPGHSPGSVSFIFPEARFVVSGDALFAGSVGCSDLPFGDGKQLLEVIKSELFTLPKDYAVYPGHRGASTIGKEIETNPFFRF